MEPLLADACPTPSKTIRITLSAWLTGTTEGTSRLAGVGGGGDEAVASPESVTRILTTARPAAIHRVASRAFRQRFGTGDSQRLPFQLSAEDMYLNTPFSGKASQRLHEPGTRAQSVLCLVCQRNSFWRVSLPRMGEGHARHRCQMSQGNSAYTRQREGGFPSCLSPGQLIVFHTHGRTLSRLCRSQDRDR